MWLEAEYRLKNDDFESFETLLIMNGIDSWERTWEEALSQLGNNYNFIEDGLKEKNPPAIKITAEDNENSIRLFQKIADLSGIKPRLKTENEADWADEWKKFYHPMEIGRRLCICPEWKKYENSSRIICKVEPGGVFGIGLHQTIRLCLEFLDESVKGGENILDLGCGSGILGIVGLLLGADRALGVDIEEPAYAAALGNAAINGKSDKFRVINGNALTEKDILPVGEKYDIITVNIVSDVIIAFAPLVRKLLAPEGLFIVSGIIAQRLDYTERALQTAGFKILRKRQQNDWCALLLA